MCIRDRLGTTAHGATCAWDGKQVVLKTASDQAGNKKFTPRTVVAVTQKGRLSERGSGPSWTFDSGEDLVLDMMAWEKADKRLGAT
eukprot:15209026-Alexandrium_andersonii.AAC.1